VNIGFSLGLGAQIIGDVQGFFVEQRQLVIVRRADGIMNHDIQLWIGTS
jgi:hypothetical protein